MVPEAGAHPPVIEGLTAEPTERGVLLHWTSNTEAEGSMATAIRIHRTRIINTPPSDAPSEPSPELMGHDMVVEDGLRTGMALDTEIHRGETYEYSAQRVFRITVAGQTLELAGQFSAPVDIDTTAGVHRR